MKKFLFLLLALVLSVSVSCSDDKTGDTGGSMLSVTPTEIEFEAAGGSRLLDLRTDAGAWSLTQSDNTAWCTPALTSGKTSTSFAVTATANESSKRSATLTFTAPGCDPVVVTVTQSGDASQDFEGEQVVAQPDAWDNRKRADISYQLLVYSFADGNGDKVGDLRGLTRRLDYIDALGASAVWLSPIHPAASYHGYDVLDYEAVNPAFGSDADLRAFIDAAHARGIRVYLDYVLNHTGKDHPWFKSAAASEGSPYRDRYIFSEDPQADIAAGRIDQIATEGAAGYDAGQWFSTDTGAGAAGRFKFVLDWTNADSPTVTVTETTDAADADNTQGGADDKYLYFGNGTSKRFYARGGNSYELTLDFDSDWGFLVRTSTTSWAAGTKYGAPDNRTIIRFGEPFTLMSNRSADPANVQFSLPTMYHSHFWTAAFADLNYGKAAEAEQSGAFKAVTEAADKWVRMGVDGFRLDAVKHIYHNAYNDENPTFLKKFYDRMNESYKAAGGEGDFYMVGEMLDEADKAAPYYRGLPALFEFTFWYKLKWALQNGIGCYFVKDILDVQPLYAQYRSDYIEATKLSNHDEDRTGSDLGQSVEKMKVAAAVLLTAQGAPYIYAIHGFQAASHTNFENALTEGSNIRNDIDEASSGVLLSLENIIFIRLDSFQLLLKVLNFIDVQLLFNIVLRLLHIGHQFVDFVGELRFFFLNLLLFLLNFPADLLFLDHLLPDGFPLLPFFILFHHIGIYKAQLFKFRFEERRSKLHTINGEHLVDCIKRTLNFRARGIDVFDGNALDNAICLSIKASENLALLAVSNSLCSVGSDNKSLAGLDEIILTIAQEHELILYFIRLHIFIRIDLHRTHKNLEIQIIQNVFQTVLFLVEICNLGFKLCITLVSIFDFLLIVVQTVAVLFCVICISLKVLLMIVGISLCNFISFFFDFGVALFELAILDG